MQPEKGPGTSPILGYLLRHLEEMLPPDQKAKLEPYEAAVSLTTHKGDLHRAWRAAGWAVELTTRPEHSALGRAAKTLEEGYRLWKDSWFGAAFGLSLIEGVRPAEDIETEWVDEALKVAQAAAEQAGWDSVPWEQLLQELIDVG